MHSIEIQSPLFVSRAGQMLFPVRIIFKQCQAVKGTNHDVMSKTGVIYSGFSWHGYSMIVDNVPVSGPYVQLILKTIHFYIVNIS